MLLPAFASACMPARAEALNDLSAMPPVSVTMPPRVLPAAAAPLPELAAGAEEPEPDGAEVVLLPHAAITTDADTASAAVAHALCFTLTSTGPARPSAWPHIRPRLSRRLCRSSPAGKGTHGSLACSLPNRNPIMMAVLAWLTETRGSRAGSLVPSYKAPRYRLARSCADEGYSAAALFGAGLFGAARRGSPRPRARRCRRSSSLVDLQPCRLIRA